MVVTMHFDFTMANNFFLNNVDNFIEIFTLRYVLEVPPSLFMLTFRICRNVPHVNVYVLARNSTNTVTSNSNRHIINLKQAKVRKHGIRNFAQNETFDISSISLLSIPIISFGLGCWQVKRMVWKKELIASLKAQGKEANLRDQHFSYVVTWFSLSAITLAMWYMRFVK